MLDRRLAGPAPQDERAVAGTAAQRHRRALAQIAGRGGVRPPEDQRHPIARRAIHQLLDAELARETRQCDGSVGARDRPARELRRALIVHREAEDSDLVHGTARSWHAWRTASTAPSPSRPLVP